MPLPLPARIYLIGRIVLENRRRLQSDPGGYVYDGQFDCPNVLAEVTDNPYSVFGSFRLDPEPRDPPKPNGLYHIEAKVFHPLL